MAWMIDGNKLKEKAVFLLFPTKMELCGYLLRPVQAVTVSEIEGMLYREGVEVVRCKDCKECFTRANGTNYCRRTGRYAATDDFCSCGERREGE